MKKIPFEIKEAIVQVCGKAFWLKDPLKSFLISCDVPSALYDRFADESKYKIVRHILSELDVMGEEGFNVQQKIITELCKLRSIPDPTVLDRDAAVDSIKYLKKLAITQKLFIEEEKKEVEQRVVELQRKQAAIAARAQKMQELHQQFMIMSISKDDPQERGYSLEDLLSELFEVHEIPYRRPYRTSTEQIDGHFSYKGFDYLVEARWRAQPPSEADLAAFKIKVDKKLQSTRGIFVSIIGYRQEVVLEFTKGVTSNIVLLDGSDISLILEGHISLVDALEIKTQKAAQEGIIYFPLREKFSQN